MGLGSGYRIDFTVTTPIPTFPLPGGRSWKKSIFQTILREKGQNLPVSGAFTLFRCWSSRAQPAGPRTQRAPEDGCYAPPYRYN